MITDFQRSLPDTVESDPLCGDWGQLMRDPPHCTAAYLSLGDHTSATQGCRCTHIKGDERQCPPLLPHFERGNAISQHQGWLEGELEKPMGARDRASEHLVGRVKYGRFSTSARVPTSLKSHLYSTLQLYPRGPEVLTGGYQAGSGRRGSSIVLHRTDKSTHG